MSQLFAPSNAIEAKKNTGKTFPTTTRYSLSLKTKKKTERYFDVHPKLNTRNYSSKQLDTRLISTGASHMGASCTKKVVISRVWAQELKYYAHLFIKTIIFYLTDSDYSVNLRDVPRSKI